MKNFYLFLIGIVATLSGYAASPIDIVIDNFTYRIFPGNTDATLYSADKSVTEAIIPNAVTYKDDEYPVTSIGKSAFEGCTGLTSVTIGNSVTSIGESAFEDCTRLTSVTIPNSVTSIGKWAFDDCTDLTKVEISDIAAWCGISFYSSFSNPLYYAGHLYFNGSEVTDLVIPESVTKIGNYAFYGCTGLTSVTIGNSVTSIGESAFEDCESLTSVTIPDSVTSIGYSAFNGCTGLTGVTIPNSVTSIGNSAFSHCTGLTSVTIGNSVTSIGNSAFSHCTGLTSVTIPDSVTSIGYSAFQYCRSLTSVTIGNSVTSIGESAFEDCESLTSVTIGNSVTSIGESAFSYCYGLTSVTIGNSVTSIGEYAFYRCTGLAKVKISDIAAWCGISFGNGTSNPLNYAGHLYLNGSEITELVIPESVTSIGNYAFLGFTGLTSVKIGSSVTSIGYSAFDNCTGLTGVYITDLETWCRIKFYTTSDNPLWAGNADLYLNGEKVVDLVIPQSIETLPFATFGHCSSIETVKFPEGFKSMTGGYIFQGCQNLKEVYLPSSTIDIGGYYTFADCASLETVYCYAMTPPENTYTSAFYNSYPEYMTLHVPQGTKEVYAAAKVWNDFGRIIDDLPSASGVEDVVIDSGDEPLAVYNLQGVRLKITSPDELENLPGGIYIINGKKQYIK